MFAGKSKKIVEKCGNFNRDCEKFSELVLKKLKEYPSGKVKGQLLSLLRIIQSNDENSEHFLGYSSSSDDYDDDEGLDD